MNEFNWRVAGETYEHHGHRIFYRDGGRGDPLLLIHGFPTSSWDWSGIWLELTQQFRVIAPDMIGFGFSEKPRQYRYSIFDQADLIEGLLSRLDVSGVHVLAHDYGDTVAQELLARHEERVAAGTPGVGLRSVCLLNGGIFMEIARPRRVQRQLKGPFGFIYARFFTESRFRRGFPLIFGPDTRPSEDDLKMYWAMIQENNGTRVIHKVIQYMDERMEHKDRWTGALQRRTIPVRLIIGVHDPISGVNIGKHYEKIIPNPDVVYLNTCGHYPQMEDPHGVLRHFVEFVETAKRPVRS